MDRYLEIRQKNAKKKKKKKKKHKKKKKTNKQTQIVTQLMELPLAIKETMVCFVGKEREKGI